MNFIDGFLASDSQITCIPALNEAALKVQRGLGSESFGGIIGHFLCGAKVRDFGVDLALIFV